MKRKVPAKRVSRKKKTASSKSTAAPRSRARSHSSSKSIVKSNAESVRQKIKSDYEKSQRDLRSAREQLDEFHIKDAPAFDQWLHRTFGRHLTELRDISRQVNEADLLIGEVENEAFYNDISYPRAYRRVMRARKRAAKASSATDDNDEAESDPDEAAEDFFNPFEAFNDADNDSRNRFRASGTAEAPHTGPVKSRRIKQLYRALVRMLHPDKHSQVSPRNQEWWHQVQAAYEAGDVEQLEMILALCEIDQVGHANSTSMGLLQRMTKQFKKTLREIRAQIRKLKADPAWNFCRRQDRHVMEGQLRWRMETELDSLKIRLEELNRIIQHLKQTR